MISYISRVCLSVLFVSVATLAIAQTPPLQCNPTDSLPITDGEVSINFGSVTNAFSFNNRTSLTVGQPFIQASLSTEYTLATGFWSRFLLPPVAPVVAVSQGEFADRISISWDLDPLSAAPLDGYVITRDGAYLMDVDMATNQVLDFNVQAGEVYTYGVYGRNQFGAGVPGLATGFVNPNGVVSGSVTTVSGNPVINALVTLTPTVGNSMAFDGIDDYLCVDYKEGLPTDMLTVSAYVKIGENYDDRAIVDFGSKYNSNYWIHTKDINGQKGVTVAVGDSTSVYAIDYAFTDAPDDWHQVTMVYASGNLLLYIDGDFVSSTAADIAHTKTRLRIGADLDDDKYFDGYIDDVRIYETPLTSSDIFLTQELTPDSSSAGLVAYFKFDEGRGDFTFDLGKLDLVAAVEGAEFSDEAAPVINAGFTDDKGYYSIEGINYSKGEQFTARPSVNFYAKSAVEFNRAYQSHVDLTEIDVPDTFAVEVIVKPFDIESRQSLLSHGSGDFDLYVEAGNYHLSLDGESQVLGPATTAYRHLAINNVMGDVAFFVDGNPVTTLSYGASTYDYSGNIWRLGVSDHEDQYFTGLIDEVAFFKDELTTQEIQVHASPVDTVGLSVGDGKLISFFALDEGAGNITEDVGPLRSGNGVIHSGTFSILTYRQVATPHVFRPSDRLVIINTSNTAASGVDFTDESTVTVSGVVRFENTFCYQDSVEILVNEESYAPPIFTDRDGRFIADFEPGASITLRPVFGEGDMKHEFDNPQVELRRINRPISSILFANLTKRKITGQLSGGDSRLSVIEPTATVKMKVLADNLCYEEEITLDNQAGNFEFDELPAIPFSTALTFHDNPNVYTYMQDQGGQSSDLRLKEADTLDFRYYSEPIVWAEEFGNNQCPNGGSTPFPYLDESNISNGHRVYNKTIRMYEDYAGGRDWLKNYDLEITNNLNDEEPVTFEVRDTSAFRYDFRAGQANIAGDFTKFMQIKGTSLRNEDNILVQRAIVLGEREREASFVTKSPEVPILILRDPPGDGSSATWEQGQTHCNNWSSFVFENTKETVKDELKLGTDVVLNVGSPGATKEKKLEISDTYGIEASMGISGEAESTGEWCITSTKTITTSDSDDVPGSGSDIYYGAGINFKFAANDVLYLDLDACELRSDSTTISIEPQGFATEFVYSEWQVLNTVIPNLELVGDNTTADTWRAVVDRNNDLKGEANFTKNLTFDGLSSYTEEFQTTTSNSISVSTQLDWSAELSREFGVEFDGNGATTTLTWNMEGGLKTSGGFSDEKNTTVSFSLADDDPNDSYSIDLLDDPIYGTPVFKLRAGETMCPWIPGTLNREEIGLQFDRVSAVNIPENEAAVFRMSMSNLGQTGRDPLVYIVGIKQGSNPDGAIVTMDGESLISPIAIQLQAGETKEFLIAIEKGPDENIYNYNDIGIFAASQCQFEHALGLGYNLAAYADWEVNNPGEPVPVEADEVYEGIYNIVDLEKFYKQFLFDVEFIEPCSRVNIGFPMQDWVLTPATGNNLGISLNGYNNTDPELELLRIQYRLTGGDGAWINITDIPKADLANDPVFKSHIWDMSTLADAEYEIRALAQCNSGLDPGISRVIQGRKETREPVVFGLPQPADGVLHPGDEISITYSKRINCNKVFPADGFGTNINLNSIALQDMTLGGILIDADFICKDDKIVVVPRIPQRFIENHVLRVTATNIEDLYGLVAEQEVWEFFVNQSNLYWEGGDIDEVVVEGNELSVTREIRNQSGERTSFNIDDFPFWMQVFPTEGTLDPGQRLLVNFVFPEDLVNGKYSTTINMETIDGNEPLQVDLRVACPEPDWAVDPAQYSYSMNITAVVDIGGEITEDRLDILGAFVNGTIRGVAQLEYSRELDQHFAFLTIYGNVPAGETVTFKVWDASACLMYGSMLEEFPFVPDDLIGSPLSPQVLHTTGEVERKIYISPGWSWISTNIELGDPSINGTLALLTNPAGGFIKSQTAFSTYSTTTNSWVGSLTDMSHMTMYQYNSVMYDSLIVRGNPIDVSTPIEITPGWNWISYLPQYGLPVSRALASLEPFNGDIIKSQNAFAQYVAGVGWVGNLSFMSAPNGYLINLTELDTLVYPPQANVTGLQGPGGSSNGYVDADDRNAFEQALTLRSADQKHWQVDAQSYEYSMNAVAVVMDSDDFPALDMVDEVGAFVNGLLQGTGTVVYVEALDKFLIFMTMYANEDTGTLSFKFYDASADVELTIIESLPFEINGVVGTVEEPYVLTIGTTTETNDVAIAATSVRVYPNPAVASVVINVESAVAQDITIIIRDAQGQEVSTVDYRVRSGENELLWEPATHLAGGLYLIEVHTQEEVYLNKVILLDD